MRKVGDILVVEFVKNNREGRKPVCRIDGMICFIDRNYRGQFVHEHSIWHVEIQEIREKVMVVTPIQEIKTAAENQRELKKRMDELHNQFSQVKKKYKKTKSKHPYYSQQERKEIQKPIECIDCGWVGTSFDLKYGVCPNCSGHELV